MSEWISVKEGLPEGGVSVLACREGDSISYDAIYYEAVWSRGCVPVEPTHWMAYPDPPKAAGPFSVVPIVGCQDACILWHPDTGRISNFTDERTASSVCRRLNELWAKNKGSNEE